MQNGEVSFAAKAGEDFSARPGDTAGWTFDPGEVFFFGGPEGENLGGHG
jgi:hypothetical protein